MYRICFCWIVGWVAAAAAMVAAADIDKLEANTWVTLKDAGNGHWGNPMVWSPTRGQFLHYTAYDVKAFDAGKGKWTADYVWPRDEGFEVASIHHHNRGVGYKGSGMMTPSGVPCPALTIGGVTWDAKRGEVIVVMHGLMAAYDPQSRKWRDMKPQTELGGEKMPGPPGVYAPSICYDPVSDQLVMFPHWGGRNTDLRNTTGEISGHYGTFVYSFSDNVWKRPQHPLGPPDVVRARNELIELMGRLSETLDDLYTANSQFARSPRAFWRAVGVSPLVGLTSTTCDQWANAHRSPLVAALPRCVLCRRPNSGELAAAAGQLGATADALERFNVPDEAQTDIVNAVASLITAREAAAAGDAATAIKKGGHAFWLLRQVRQRRLRVEPPPRCGAPLVYHPEQEAIIMFGGQTGLLRTDLDEPEHHGRQPGSLNDTWIYDCRTRQWRQLDGQRRPPPTLWPKLVYDPDSRKVVLVTIDSRWGGEQPDATLWTLDIAKSEWSDCGTQPLPGPVGFDGWYGWGNQQFEVGYDPQRKLLLMVTAPDPRRNRSEVNYALRLDVSKLAAKPAPDWEPPEPPRPHEIPPDDPAWIAKLQSIPANTWIKADPKGRRVQRRDWGMAACDPVRGDVYYFGGGHSTYQGRNVAVYAVGANRWCHAAGGHNDHVPPVGWGGVGIDYWGAPKACHQRNSYLAVDGRMYVNLGTANRRWAEAAGQRPGPRFAWFYDVDRGGIWRELEIEQVERTPPNAGFYGNPHMASADGKAMGFGGALHPYDGRFFAGEAYFSVLDIYENSLKLKRIPPPMPDPVLECRPFCYLPDKKSVFFLEAGSKRKTPPQVWTYEFTTNKFTQRSAKNHPPGDPLAVLYLEGQDAVFALMKESGENQPKPWIYCLQRNAWAPILTRSEDDVHFQRPYAQTVYSAKYGVLVNLPGTEVMRPDISSVQW